VRGLPAPDVVESANPGTATTIVASHRRCGLRSAVRIGLRFRDRFPATLDRTSALGTDAPLGSSTRPVN
jgi:hypothetical protein